MRNPRHVATTYSTQRLVDGGVEVVEQVSVGTGRVGTETVEEGAVQDDPGEITATVEGVI